MNVNFPRTTVGGMSLPRMIIGTNWILGYSHKTVSMDEYIIRKNGNRDAIAGIVEAFLGYGVDAIMGPLSKSEPLIEGVKLAEERTGKKVIRIDTPIMNVDND